MNHATAANLLKIRSNGPMGRRRFREHLQGCSKCRLTQYSGTLLNQWSADEDGNRYADTGALCKVGLALWVGPEHLRESADPKNSVVTTEVCLRLMGFPRGI